MKPELSILILIGLSASLFTPVAGFGGDGNISFEPPREICYNDVDDDNDGEVDEGWDRNNDGVEEPCREICNGDDDDKDGKVDEGVCQQTPVGPVPCTNNKDDNNHDGTDFDDRACVSPAQTSNFPIPQSVVDPVEGNIYDTDLSRQLLGPASNPGPGGEDRYFNGTVKRGDWNPTFEKLDYAQDTGDNKVYLVEQYLNYSRPEGGGWAFSQHLNLIKQSNSGNPQQPSLTISLRDSKVREGALVDPPHDIPGSSQDNRITRGNGIQEQNYGSGSGKGYELIPQENKGYKRNDSKKNDFPPSASGHPNVSSWENKDGIGARTPVRADYGRKWEKYSRKKPLGKGDLTCKGDKANVEAVTPIGASSCLDVGQACGGTGNPRPTCTTIALTKRPDANNDGIDDVDTYYWETSGDKLVKYNCKKDGPAAEDSCTYRENRTANTNPTCQQQRKECDLGTNRSFQRSTVDCSMHNVVDGGGDARFNGQETDIRGNKYKGYEDMGDNDPAATKTEFTAYSNDNWGEKTFEQGGNEDTEDGSAWCGYDKTITIDADGPNGSRDGFVVISNRGKNSQMDTGRSVDPNRHTGDKIIGTKVPPYANHEPGNKPSATEIFINDSSTSAGARFVDKKNSIERKMRAQGKLDCPGDKQICVAYIDKVNHWNLSAWNSAYFFDDNGDDPGSWSGSSGSRFMVNVKGPFLPNQSYSVCKFANNATDREVLDCDYLKNDKLYSPLNGTCGDEPGERMIAQEGQEVRHNRIDNFPAFKQECHDYGASLKEKGMKNFYNYSNDKDWGPSLARNYTPPSVSNGGNSDGIKNYSLKNTYIKHTGLGDQNTADVSYKWDTLRRNKTYNFTSSLEIESGGQHTVQVDLDWDTSTDFQAGEKYTVGSCSTDNCIVSTNITIPPSAGLGPTLMRVKEKGPGMSNFDEVYSHVLFLNRSKRNINDSTEEACVLDGQVYSEGSLVDVTSTRYQHRTEAGGGSIDKEICIGGMEDTGSSSSDKNLAHNWKTFDEDNGGVWVDIDSFEATKYIRENLPLDNQSYRSHWVSNPDVNASINSSITGVKPEYVNEKGLALEDDCRLYGNSGQVIDCEDMGGGIGQETPTWANFSEGTPNDDYDDNLDFSFPVDLRNVHNRVQSAGETGHSQANMQDDEPANLSNPNSSIFLPWYNDAGIDSKDDEWSYTPNLRWAVANNGSAWPPNRCHGAERVQGINKNKTQAVYANSFVNVSDVYTGFEHPRIAQQDGNWVNPDNTVRSATEGGVSCDLTGEDWGYAVRSTSVNSLQFQGNRPLEGDPSSPGIENVNDFIPHSVAIPQDSLAFDYESDPKGYNQSNLKQWPDACGDDRNEFLIREHAADLGGEYNPSFSGRDNYYVCADRPSDCALDGKVYSEGNLADVSTVEETGAQSTDQEVCLDIVEELPGGEWYDVDNQTVREHLIGSGTPDNPEKYVRTGQIEPVNYTKPFWHNSSTGDPIRDSALNEARMSPYSPLGLTNFYNKDISYSTGYALEDDCDPDLASPNPGCDDKGVDESRGTDSDPSSNLIYSHFRESKNGIAVKSDDFDTETSWVVRMYVNGTPYHGSSTGQMSENTKGVNFDSTNWNWPTSGVNDSAINVSEDTWAISSETYDAVGPTGSVYDTGQCYGRSPPEHSEGWVLKNETVMANSFAEREEVNSDGRAEGNWVDPDTTKRTVSLGGLSCDLNSTDWGIGFNTSGSNLNIYRGNARQYGYSVDDRHVVSGPIAFDDGQKPLGENQNDLKQYPNACGDDQNEFLIREQYSSYHGDEIYPNLTDRNNTYVCADRITDCAYNGAVYSEGQTLDISSQTSHNQEMGEQLPDEEICLDLNKSTPGGEWYDKDQEFTPEHRIKGLEDTYNVSNPSFTRGTRIDISGVVEGESSGVVNITDRDTNLNSDGSFFMSNVAADPGEMQLLKYYNSSGPSGQLEAQIRLRFPSDGSDVERVHLSPELMYNGSEVWSGMEKFSDHDFDRNKYHSRYNSTDWRNQTTRYDRTDLAYFNRTGGYYSPPSHRTNVRGQQKRYYSPEGYATEDDCGPLLSKSSTGPCGDVGDDTQHQSWFSAGNFTGMAP